MIIPRERVSPTEVITRVYCQMEDAESDPSVSAIGSATSGAIDKKAEEERASISSAKERAKKRRQEVSLERILSQIKKVLEPYPIDFGEVDWWVRHYSLFPFYIHFGRIFV